MTGNLGRSLEKHSERNTIETKEIEMSVYSEKYEGEGEDDGK